MKEVSSLFFSTVGAVWKIKRELRDQWPTETALTAHILRPQNRDAAIASLKKSLEKKLEHDYHGEVMDVYFTDFVTQ